jgi:hypothetical protein
MYKNSVQPLSAAEAAYIHDIKGNLEAERRISYWVSILTLVVMFWLLGFSWIYEKNIEKVASVLVPGILVFVFIWRISKRLPMAFSERIIYQEGKLEKRLMGSRRSIRIMYYLNGAAVLFPTTWSSNKLFSFDDYLRCEGCYIPLGRLFRWYYGAEQLYVVTRLNDKFSIEAEKEIKGRFTSKNISAATIVLFTSAVGVLFYIGTSMAEYGSLTAPIQLAFEKQQHFSNLNHLIKADPHLNSRVQISNAAVYYDYYTLSDIRSRKTKILLGGPKNLISYLEALAQAWRLRESELVALAKLEPVNVNSDTLTQNFPYLSKRPAFSRLVTDVDKLQQPPTQAWWDRALHSMYNKEHYNINRSIRNQFHRKYNKPIEVDGITPVNIESISLEHIKRGIVSRKLEKMVRDLNSADYANRNGAVTHVRKPNSRYDDYLEVDFSEKYSMTMLSLLVLSGLVPAVFIGISLLYIAVFILSAIAYRRRVRDFYQYF